jgi:putative flavoprotein involved in K+ transport
VRDGGDPSARRHVEVAVVGGGQAGLAIGHLLARRGRRFVIYEASEAVGAAWRARWASLVLFTPRRHSALPGMAFPGDPDGYPTRDEVATYLERYAAAFALPVETRRRVTSLAAGDEGFDLDVDGDGRVGADQVVVATGAFQTPRVPAIAGRLSPDVTQFHSAAYRSPDGVPAGTVLVVGGGNTGFQIAADLSPTHRVHLSVGSRQTPLPQRLLGRDLFWWLQRVGIFERSVETRVGRRARGRDVLIGSSPRAARRHGIGLKPRAVRASGRAVGFADGSSLEPDAVIWATGYDVDHSWIHLPVFGDDGALVHRRGVTSIPGLYFLGLSWQWTRGSALLGWVKDDAAYIADRIAAAEEPRPIDELEEPTARSG